MGPDEVSANMVGFTSQSTSLWYTTAPARPEWFVTVPDTNSMLGATNEYL